MNFFKSILFPILIGLNPILCAMDPSSIYVYPGLQTRQTSPDRSLNSGVYHEPCRMTGQDTPFQCKVPVNKATAQAGDQSVTTQQETKKTQAALDAAQFAKERESKRRNALQNALASNEKPDFQFCKTALLCKKKLPAVLQRYVCSYLDKQFYLDRSFKAHNDTFEQVITHTKADGTWYILALTSDNIVAKIDGSTGEVLSVIDKIPNIYRIFIHSESENLWFINIVTHDNQIFSYDGEECERVEARYDVPEKEFEYCWHCANASKFKKGSKQYEATRGFLEIKIYSRDPCKLEKRIVSNHRAQDLLYGLPMALHIQPKGNLDFVVTHQDGQMSIISEGPETFEQCLTNNFIPSLELPLPVKPEEINDIKPAKKKRGPTSLLRKIAIAGTSGALAVGTSYALGVGIIYVAKKITKQLF